MTLCVFPVDPSLKVLRVDPEACVETAGLLRSVPTPKWTNAAHGDVKFAQFRIVCECVFVVNEPVMVTGEGSTIDALSLANVDYLGRHCWIRDQVFRWRPLKSNPTNTLRAKGRPFAAIQPGHSKVPTWKIGSSGRSFYSYTAAQSSLTPKLSNSSVFLLPLLDFTKMFEFLLINSVLVNFLRGSIHQ